MAKVSSLTCDGCEIKTELAGDETLPIGWSEQFTILKRRLSEHEMETRVLTNHYCAACQMVTTPDAELSGEKELVITLRPEWERSYRDAEELLNIIRETDENENGQ